MKKLIFIILAVLCTIGVQAQAPEKIGYQSIVRQVGGEVLSGQSVGVRFSISPDITFATSDYVEMHTEVTDINGLINLNIGDGTIVSGTMSAIMWETGPMYIKIEKDLTGGVNYTMSEISEFLSSPYSLYANEALIADSVRNIPAETDPAFTGSPAGTITNTDISNWNLLTTDNFYLGQDTLGGIVFHITKDRNGVQHGLIVNYAEHAGLQWQVSNSVTGADKSWDGAYNTDMMVTSQIPGYLISLGTGWYLPSIDELFTLWNNRLTVNKALDNGSYQVLGHTPAGPCWSSSESNVNFASTLHFGTGDVETMGGSTDKVNSWPVRAIRSF